MAEGKRRIGLVGARGYVGQELLKILVRHPSAEVAFVSSTTQAGAPALAGHSDLRFEDLSADAIADRGADAVVLALPNDRSHPFVNAVEQRCPGTALVDLSTDHRLAAGWVYGLPEQKRAAIRGALRIANPGCYATAAALAVGPVTNLLAAPAQAFGVSGYSGAGTAPSPRNDVDALRDNLMPYSLIGHAHELEVTRHVGPVALMPHVAPFFRGISMTVSLLLTEPLSREALLDRYRVAYAGEPLVRIQEEIPLVRAIAGQPFAVIGGFAADPKALRATLVVTLDNLLKGAASQAVQNLNLSLGLPELAGIDQRWGLRPQTPASGDPWPG